MHRYSRLIRAITEYVGQPPGGLGDRHWQNKNLQDYLKNEELDSNHNFWIWGEITEKALLQEYSAQLGLTDEQVYQLEGEQYGEDDNYELHDNIIEKILPLIKRNEKQSIQDAIQQNASESEHPSWFHLNYQRPIQNEWLVHFSNDADSIAHEGFKYGTMDYQSLGLTTWRSKESKKYGGYAFAFVAGTRDCKHAANDGNYGKAAVMFRATGVEAYHNGDQENQVIFWGPSVPKNGIVLIQKSREDGEWYVPSHYRSTAYQSGRDVLYKNSDFLNVTNWVERNAFQYRRQLVDWSPKPIKKVPQ